MASPAECGRYFALLEPLSTPTSRLCFGWKARAPCSLRRVVEAGASESRIDALARRLYQWLIEPVEPSLANAQQIVLCPDGELHSVAWSLLKGSDNRYLIERYTLCTASSATVWAQARRKLAPSRTASQRPLMVALSEFPKASTGGVRGNLGALPSVRQERAVFQRMFGRTARLLSEAQAVRERVLSAFQDATLVHIASHAIPNFHLPFFSAIALYGRQAPSWVYAQDILQSRLSARLVVLSACNTAEGSLSNDGMMGLAWAFMVAGCPSVLATLWKLPDESVPIWIEAFYRAYRQGRSVAECVRAATLSLLKNPRYRHPRHWGAWLVQGAG